MEGRGCGDRRLDPKCLSRERSVWEANELRFAQYNMHSTGLVMSDMNGTFLNRL